MEAKMSNEKLLSLDELNINDLDRKFCNLDGDRARLCITLYRMSAEQQSGTVKTDSDEILRRLKAIGFTSNE